MEDVVLADLPPRDSYRPDPAGAELATRAAYRLRHFVAGGHHSNLESAALARVALHCRDQLESVAAQMVLAGVPGPGAALTARRALRDAVALGGAGARAGGCCVEAYRRLHYRMKACGPLPGDGAHLFEGWAPADWAAWVTWFFWHNLYEGELAACVRGGADPAWVKQSIACGAELALLPDAEFAAAAQDLLARADVA